MDITSMRHTWPPAGWVLRTRVIQGALTHPPGLESFPLPENIRYPSLAPAILPITQLSDLDKHC